MDNDSDVFFGEIALDVDNPPDKNLGDFENLPNIQIVRYLANKFGDTLELIPYQEAGHPVKIALCGYASLRIGNGKFIIVLVKDNYSGEKDYLLGVVNKGIGKLKKLAEVSDRYEKSSLDNIFEKLNLLSEEINKIM